jgi:hypothetical protein
MHYFPLLKNVSLHTHMEITGQEAKFVFELGGSNYNLISAFSKG